MSDIQQPLFFLDQTGQLLDIRFEVERIRVVDRLADGANGKICPKCGASPMRRTHVVWDENTRQHDDGVMILTNIATRVAPPTRPSAPELQYAYVRDKMTLALPLTVLFLFVIGGSSALTAFIAIVRRGPAAWQPTLLCIGVFSAGVAFLLHIRKGDRARTRAEQEKVAQQFALETEYYESQLRQEQKLFNRWKHSWFCTSCAEMAAEPRPGQ